MRPRATRTVLAVALLAMPLSAQGPRIDPEMVHDPSTVVVENGVRRVLATGNGVAVVREQPDGRWLREGSLFPPEARPAWHARLVPENRGHLWAPDLIQIDGEYHVYYSVSTFGKNRSAIGLAVGPTLDPSSPSWRWEDRGPVIASRPGVDFNAIDPAAFRDPADGKLWLTFGSFWGGIFLTELNPKTGLRLHPDLPPTPLAWAPDVEAPFLFKRDEYYYLFINWGKCCRGVDSTYEIRVGRSQRITGPYLDRDGNDLRHRGGTLLLGTSGPYIGPGHPSIHRRDGQDWLVHHSYDANHSGRARLRMVPLSWDDAGWPIVFPPRAAGRP